VGNVNLEDVQEKQLVYDLHRRIDSRWITFFMRVVEHSLELELSCAWGKESKP
jgi:hypothetical protein